MKAPQATRSAAFYGSVHNRGKVRLPKRIEEYIPQRTINLFYVRKMNIEDQQLCRLSDTSYG
jgi:hypothetical protein